VLDSVYLLNQLYKKDTYIDDYYGEIIERYYGGEYCFELTNNLIINAMKKSKMLHGYVK
jgi:hypothetical protein